MFWSEATVTLSHHMIAVIEESTFDGMVYLQQLWLNHNQLETVPRFLPATLQRLLLESNRIRDLTDAFPDRGATEQGAYQLNTLSLAGNSVYELKPVNVQ